MIAQQGYEIDSQGNVGNETRSIEEDCADIFDGMCLKCFMEATDQTRWSVW